MPDDVEVANDGAVLRVIVVEPQHAQSSRIVLFEPVHDGLVDLQQSILTRPELEEKFLKLASTRIRPDDAGQLLALVNDLERLDDTARLMKLLSVPEDGV